MNNWEKSNLELTPAPEMAVLDDSGSLSVLIKHDYYSSDNDHGRFLLSSFFDTLADCGDSISKIFIIDSAVRLLDDVSISGKLVKLFALSNYSYICDDSLAYFDVEYSSHDNVIVCSFSDISIELLQAGNLITLE